MYCAAKIGFKVQISKQILWLTTYRVEVASLDMNWILYNARVSAQQNQYSSWLLAFEVGRHSFHNLSI
jgi:hypothetical protein